MTVSRRFVLTRGLAAAAGATAALSPSMLPRAAASDVTGSVGPGAGPLLRPTGREPMDAPVARLVPGTRAAGAVPATDPVPVPISAWEEDIAATVEPVRGALLPPFTLGVASGEPAPDSVVLWTRLAPEPLAPDGRGGMPRRDVEVEWQVAQDPAFRRVVRTGTTVARPSGGHSVHVEVRGLEPAREYHYRFRTGGHLSPAGRTRTAPAPTSRAPVTFAVTSCAHWEHGWFTAYRHIAGSAPDLILNIGDYLYEAAPGAYASPTGFVREHVGPGRASTLAGYRLRHAQYKTDPDLQAAHAVAPWVVTWDDHEVMNNWAGATAAREADQARFPQIRAAAMQAYYEHMPFRRSARPAGGHMQIFRRLGWGRVATFHVLDTRQYRDDQACGDGLKPYCPPRHGAARTVLGARQEAWLAAGLQQSQAAWDVLAQQVMFSPNWLSNLARGVSGTSVSGYNLDSWDGYPAARDRLLAAVADAKPQNLVVLTGDTHTAWASEILRPYSDPASAPVGVELVASSVSSGGDGAATADWGLNSLKLQPYLRFFDQRRGWISVTCATTQMRADFHVLDYVSRPGAAARRGASFVVEDGTARLLPS